MHSRSAPAPDAEAAREAYAAILGMWVFLASELLLFAALLTLYAAYRVHHPDAFAEGIRRSLKLSGSVNTLLLLVSSWCVATATGHAEAARPRAARRHLLAAMALGLGFLALKAHEYGHHIAQGLVPGSRAHASTPGLSLFFTLYYALTGLHAVHVAVGLGVLAAMALRVHRWRPHAIEAGALYWHLVDVVWIILWPLFYLTGGPS
ncbi:MAG TPA: cytochrome c oxidase subunit 3 [Myxococcota bacterium]|nr:cytochrome c oxidase subunit 3 [Myxococcota bacterium]